MHRMMPRLPAAITQAHERIIGERPVASADKILSLYEKDLLVIVRGKAGAEVERVARQRPPKQRGAHPAQQPELQFGNTLLLSENLDGIIIDHALLRDTNPGDTRLPGQSTQFGRETNHAHGIISFCCLRAVSSSSCTLMEPDPNQQLEAEIDLLKRVGQGDRRSFEELYDQFSGVLFSVAFRVLNNQEAAEDVLQDVFIQIWEKAPLYDPTRGKPMTWAITLTRNKAIDRLRSTQRRSRLQDEMEREAETFEKFDDKSSFDAAAGVETGKLVREAIQKLSKDQREAIELAFFSSLTQTEIAERLNEPLGTVKARIRRGMMKLKELLSPRL